MSVGKQMIEQLRLLSVDTAALAQLPTGDERFKRLAVHDGTNQAALEFFDCDRYSVTMSALEVGGGAFEGDTRAYLSACAAEIARRLSYLEEPLAVWELDGGERVAQLRSSPPQRDGDEVLYWEVTLSIGAQPSARLLRCRWVPGMAEREVVAYPAAFAVIGRMADSLDAALRDTNP